MAGTQCVPSSKSFIHRRAMLYPLDRRMTPVLMSREMSSRDPFFTLRMAQ